MPARAWRGGKQRECQATWRPLCDPRAAAPAAAVARTPQRTRRRTRCWLRRSQGARANAALRTPNWCRGGTWTAPDWRRAALQPCWRRWAEARRHSSMLACQSLTAQAGRNCKQGAQGLASPTPACRTPRTNTGRRSARQSRWRLAWSTAAYQVLTARCIVGRAARRGLRETRRPCLHARAHHPCGLAAGAQTGRARSRCRERRGRRQ